MASGKNIQPYTYIEITTTTNADGYALIAHGGYIPIAVTPRTKSCKVSGILRNQYDIPYAITDKTSTEVTIGVVYAHA